MNHDVVVNLSKWSSEICSLCWPVKEFCGISAGEEDFMVDALHARHWNCGSLIRWLKISLMAFIKESNIARGLPKTLPCGPDKFHVSSGVHRSRLNIDRGLGTTDGWLGTWEIFPDETIWTEVQCFPKPVDVLKKNLRYQKTFLDSTCLCLKTTQPASRTLRNSRWTWHQVCSHREINLRSVRICLSLL